jgi:FAD synthetase
MNTKKIVLATGVFDIIHPGHIYYLNEAKKLGDRLVVIIAHDQTVEKRKGKAPLLTQQDRKLILENLKMVDEVVLGQETNFIQTAIDIAPNVIVLGWDQKVDEESIKKEFEKVGLKVEFQRVPRFQEYSSGRIKEKITL